MRQGEEVEKVICHWQQQQQHQQQQQQQHHRQQQHRLLPNGLDRGLRERKKKNLQVTFPILPSTHCSESLLFRPRD